MLAPTPLGHLVGRFQSLEFDREESLTYRLFVLTIETGSEVYFHPCPLARTDGSMAVLLADGRIGMDDEEVLRKKLEWEPKNLEYLSIDQLEDYITVLEGEVARVRANISAKKSDLSIADSFFQK